jgi:hypothetical protein
MSRATPTIRDFAKTLVVYETGGNRNPGTKAPATFQACERLRPHLTTLMGDGGFRALLSRALALAKVEAPWLRAVQVKADGALEEMEGLQAHLDAGELFEGRVALLTQLLGLLVAFIGEDLTMRLVREVWPKVPLNDLDLNSGNGVKHENTK